VGAAASNGNADGTGRAAAVAAGPSDEVLVARVKAGDRRAFDVLAIRYKDRIFNLCYRKLGCAEEALDASQEAFLKAYKAVRSFEGKSKFYTWLFRIALNCAFTRRKRRTREREVMPVSTDQGPGGGDGEGGGGEAADVREEPAARVMRGEKARLIEEAIGSLEEDFHRIVLLRDVEGLAYEEIAEILDIPVGSVKSRLHRARLVLRDKLKAYLSLGEVS
jgi:RNA polymerase sigma-70 factor (ECF subfamily)